MRRMGFANRWIRLIMMCVTTVKYAVVVNGTPSGYFLPTRGLRQGDLISPYLFLICAEVLSSMVTIANQKGFLTRVPTSKYGPRVSHLFFADDSLLFCRRSLTQWNHLTQLLQRYEAASGQRLNSNKAALYFSKNTSHEDKKEIVEVAGIPVNQRYDTYLGLPCNIPIFFFYLINKFECYAKIISHNGKITNFQYKTIPLKYFSLYKIPTTIPNMAFKQIYLTV
jgi:hypothetical protein